MLFLAAIICIADDEAQSILDKIKAFLDATPAIAVQVDVEAIGSVGETRFSYSFWKNKEGVFRLDFENAAQPPSLPQKTILTTYENRIRIYDPIGNRYRDVDPLPNLTAFENLQYAFGQTDSLLRIYIEGSKGVDAYLKQFGELHFEKASSPQGRLIIQSKLESESERALLIITCEENGFIREIQLKLDERFGASWKIQESSLSTAEALPFEVPIDARNVGRQEEPPSIIENEETQRTIDQSIFAYENLKSVTFYSKAQLFTQEGESIRQANFWWERDKRFRFAVTTDRPDRSFAALYKENSLQGWNRTEQTSFSGTVDMNSVVRVLEYNGATFEPMILAILDKQMIWKRFQTPGSRLRKISERVVDGELCEVIETKMSSGWNAKIFVRNKDGLIARIDRELVEDNQVLYSEIVSYRYNIINGKIPETVWKLNVPNNTKRVPLQRGG